MSEVRTETTEATAATRLAMASARVTWGLPTLDEVTAIAAVLTGRPRPADAGAGTGTSTGCQPTASACRADGPGAGAGIRPADQAAASQA
ncbi:hypothetical protein ACX6XY_08650 [Streptomyces sp. O3]